MYGAGPSTLYDERTLTPATRLWMEDQLSWAPIRLYRQIVRSLSAGRLVPLREWPDDLLRNDLFDVGPQSHDARITFMAGAQNRTFSPLGQQRTLDWFSTFQPCRHRFCELEGFGHLDVWLRPDVEAVHALVLNGLSGWPEGPSPCTTAPRAGA